LNRALQPAIRNFTLLFFGCLLFHLAGTWSLPLIDRDEPRFAEASREMLQRGDYVIPFFNNQYRFDKPPFTYWCQTLSYRVFGENDFAARFPSAIAAAVTAILLLAWGRRLESEHAGWWAAIIFTLCLQTFMHAKAAVADMWLTLFVTAAQWAGYELLRGRIGGGGKRPTPKAFASGLSNVQHPTSNEEPLRTAATTVETPGGEWWWMFYLALAFAFLAKGPIGWTPLLTLAAMKFLWPDLRLADRFAPLTGMILMLGIVALWATPALIRTHGEFFRVGIGHHVVERSLVAMEGHGGKSLGWYLLTLPFYFITVFISFFPWSIKLPWLTRKLWRNPNAPAGDQGDKGRDATDNYLIAGIAIIFLIFTLLKTKLPHYTLPAFPLLALLLARHWSRLDLAAINFKRTAIVGVCIWLVIALFIFPFTRRYSPAVQLLEAARNDLRTEMEFGAVEYNEPSLVWYFRSRVRGFFNSALDPASVKPFMERPGSRFVIMPATLAGEIYPTLPAEWKSFSTHGFNVAKGKRVDLTLILKPSDA
jgi:4-amino-4-deoxy-L-arabinose transferase-like glycosyltransferase